MNTLPVHCFSIVLVFSFLLPGIGWMKAPLEDIEQTHYVYLPLIKNDPIGMAYVPAGEFTMGCWGGYFCSAGGGPVHSVFLDGFFIDKYEITNAQYTKCVAVGACLPPGATGSHTRFSYYDNPAYADYPVTHVPWDYANDYCQWAGKRLPTEAEWEKAAQGGKDFWLVPFPWGDATPVCEIGAPNGAQYSDCLPQDTVQVGSFGPNGIGLYDMAGNVDEWVNDWWDISYYSNSPYSNPPGPASGSDKVIRGGGWNYNWTGLLVAYRNYANPNNPTGIQDLGYHNVGFRCVFSPPHSP